MQLRRYQFALLASLGLFPLPALAHLVSTGFGPVYDGIGHFFLSVEDLLPLLAIMALGGLHGAAGGRRILLVLPATWLLSAIVGAKFMAALELPPTIGSLLCLAIGIAVACDLRLSIAGLTALVVLLASVLGSSTGIALAAQSASVTMLIGSAAALAVTSALIIAVVIKATSHAVWMRIAVRVAGSWIAGVGLLMLGWLLRA